MPNDASNNTGRNPSYSFNPQAFANQVAKMSPKYREALADSVRAVMDDFDVSPDPSIVVPRPNGNANVNGKAWLNVIDKVIKDCRDSDGRARMAGRSKKVHRQTLQMMLQILKKV